MLRQTLCDVRVELARARGQNAMAAMKALKPLQVPTAAKKEQTAAKKVWEGTGRWGETLSSPDLCVLTMLGLFQMAKKASSLLKDLHRAAAAPPVVDLVRARAETDAKVGRRGRELVCCRNSCASSPRLQPPCSRLRDSCQTAWRSSCICASAATACAPTQRQRWRAVCPARAPPAGLF